MHHSRFVGCIAIASALLVSACVAPHNDTLLFGTDTKVALDVGAPPENAGIPQLTIGYKRREFVWMPLYVNARDSKVVPLIDDGDALAVSAGARITAPADAAINATKGQVVNVPKGSVVTLGNGVSVTFENGTKLIASDDLAVPKGTSAVLPAGSTVVIVPGSEAMLGPGEPVVDLFAARFKYIGTGPGKNGQGVETDTYSVLASIGANISGGADSGATGTVAIAQFIATGIAARRLAEKGGANLFSVRAPSETQLKAAEERAEKAEMRADDAQNKIINLTTTLTKESFSQASLDRVGDVALKVDNLPAPKAIKMVDDPPVKDAEMDLLVQEFDQPNERSSDEAVAKRMLKLRIFNGKTDEGTLAIWEAALDWAP